MNIRIGTSGYSFQDWKGPFYPQKLSGGAMLEYYAAYFDVAEINSSYYRIPARSGTQRMVRVTPNDFGFVVKLHKSMTHDRNPSPEDFTAFNKCLEPMAEQGKLLGLLAQFPWSFKDTVENRDYVTWMRGQLSEYPWHVEFRHISWIENQGVEFLKRNNAGYCIVDEPQLEGLVPPLVHVLGDTAYIRFHGRNAQDWWHARPGSDRYLYDYSDAELEEWIPRVRQAAESANSTLVFFNNCHFGNAPRNALRLKELMGLPACRGVSHDNELILEP